MRSLPSSRVSEQRPCDSGSEQAGGNGEQPRMQTSQGHARTITRAFMHALMHLCQRESQHTLLAQPWRFRLARTLQERKVWTHSRMSPLAPPPLGDVHK